MTFWLLITSLILEYLDYLFLINISSNGILYNILWVVLLVLLLITLLFFLYHFYLQVKNYEKRNIKFIKLLKFLTLFNIFFIGVILYLYNFYVFLFVIIVIISIMLHELGHMLLMLLNGVKVSEFSIGFWWEIFSFKFKWIKFSFRNILLWWFVKPIDEDIKEIKQIKEDSKILDKILKKYKIRKEQLYIFKSFPQKISILVAGVLMNLLIAATALFIWQQIKINSQKTLTKKQLEYIQKINKQEKEIKPMLKYVKSKVPNSIWIWNNKAKNSSLEELKNAIKITWYSLVYSIQHPIYFFRFKSLLGIWKDIYWMEQVHLMNIKILLLITTLINISLFLINIMPFPALDGWQIIKELIWYFTIKFWTEEWYIRYIYSTPVIFIEYLWFAILTWYIIILIVKDLFN